MSQQEPQPKIIKLPRSGPKPGQSTNSYLYGRSFGDRKWDAIKGANINKLINRRKPKP